MFWLEGEIPLLLRVYSRGCAKTTLIVWFFDCFRAKNKIRLLFNIKFPSNALTGCFEIRDKKEQHQSLLSIPRFHSVFGCFQVKTTFSVCSTSSRSVSMPCFGCFPNKEKYAVFVQHSTVNRCSWCFQDKTTFGICSAFSFQIKTTGEQSAGRAEKDAGQMVANKSWVNPTIRRSPQFKTVLPYDQVNVGTIWFSMLSAAFSRSVDPNEGPEWSEWQIGWALLQSSQ